MSHERKLGEPIPISSLGWYLKRKAHFRYHLCLPVGPQHSEDPGLVCNLLSHLEDKGTSETIPAGPF